jgi:LysR family transcriptional regulator, nitrogen assimilation regulatory protein
MPNRPNSNAQVLDSELRLFLRVARAGSLRAAADELASSQAGLSKRIRRLEEALGAPLFVRHGRGLRLNPFGVALQDSLHDGFGAVDAAVALVRDRNGGPAARLAMACVSTLAAYLVPRWVAHLEHIAPTLRLGITNASSPDVIEAVMHARADIGLVYDIAVTESELIATPLLDEQLVGYSAGHAAPAGGETLAAFCSRPLVLPPRDFAVRRIVERELGRPTRPLIECNSLDLTLDIVAGGRGVTLLPQALPDAPIAARGLVRVPINGAQLQRRVVVVRHAATALHEHLALALRALQDVARDLPGAAREP